MTEQLFLFIKHHLGFLWKIIEYSNDLAFKYLHGSFEEKILPAVFEEFDISPYSYRKLSYDDIEPLHFLIRSQDPSDLKYFDPHKLDLKSLRAQLKKRSFLMMGTFDGDKIVGYFFLRFFTNKKCFVGRLIDKEYRGKGIGLVMNKIMYETSWRMGFRCYSTISRKNKAVMRAHARNEKMIIRKELKNDYLLVEFVR